MNLQNFKAPTMGEALTQVKSVMGSDAVILHTRTFQTRYWLGLRRREMVEITAGRGINVGAAARVGPAGFDRERRRRANPRAAGYNRGGALAPAGRLPRRARRRRGIASPRDARRRRRRSARHQSADGRASDDGPGPGQPDPPAEHAAGARRAVSTITRT